MQPLEPPDSHHVSSAIGWLELGNTREALAEIAQISPEGLNHPDVLEARWMAAAAGNDWREGLAVAQRLVELEPKRASGWLHRAYALRRISQGGLTAAWDALLPAVGKFPKEPTIPYNLACYACQLGQIDEARQWLLRARKMSEGSGIQRMALSDEDLKPLWAEVAKW
jgi:Flp pilus assembly protein TadD